MHSTEPQGEETKEAQYRRLLKIHDWDWQYADDGRAYRHGREQRAELERMQAELDQDHCIWNSIAPQSHRKQVAKGGA